MDTRTESFGTGFFSCALNGPLNTAAATTPHARNNCARQAIGDLGRNASGFRSNGTDIPPPTPVIPRESGE